MLAGTNPQERKMYSAETWMPWKEFISQLGRGSDIWLRQGVGTVLQAIWLSSPLGFGKLIYPSFLDSPSYLKSSSWGKMI